MSLISRNVQSPTVERVEARRLLNEASEIATEVMATLQIGEMPPLAALLMLSALLLGLEELFNSVSQETQEHLRFEFLAMVNRMLSMCDQVKVSTFGSQNSRTSSTESQTHMTMEEAAAWQPRLPGFD